MPDDPSRPPLLNETQRCLAAAALTALACVALGLCLVGGVWLLRLFVISFGSVLWPLAIAGILAMLMRPLVGCFENRLRLARAHAIALLYLCIAVTCLLLALFIVPVVIEQLIALVRFQSDLLSETLQKLRAHYPQLIDTLRDTFSNEDFKLLGQKAASAAHDLLNASLPALREAGHFLGNVFAWGTAAAIVPIYLFYFLESNRDYARALQHQLTFMKPNLRDDLLFLAREFVNILVAFFRGQILIGLIMGTLLAIGFTLAGLKFAIALGLLIGLLNIVPYLGTIIGLGVALPIAYFQSPGGGWSQLATVLGIFALVQIIEGYVLTPKIMGKQTGLHPMVIIIAIFFWGTALGGILGMILAVPLTAFFIIVWRLLKQKYFPLLTSQGRKDT